MARITGATYRQGVRCSVTCALACAGMLATSLFATAAVAETTAAKLWDGAFTITEATQQCAAAGYTTLGSWRALYRARLKSTEPKAAIIIQAANLNHTIVIRAVTNTRTLQGSAAYCGIDLDPRETEPAVWTDGEYNINVTPAVVNANTRDVRISGRVTKFANVEGCNISFRAAFLRRP